MTIRTTDATRKNLKGRKVTLVLVLLGILGAIGLGWQSQDGQDRALPPVNIAFAQDTEDAGVERYFAELPEFLILNTDGKKYDTVRFSHAAHAGHKDIAGIQCQTCHHTQEGDEKPLKCSACHTLGGKAKEKRLRTRATHARNKPFPKEAGQEEVSCIGCHRSQNALLKADQRSGKEAPTKCKTCHQTKRT